MLNFLKGTIATFAPMYPVLLQFADSNIEDFRGVLFGSSECAHELSRLLCNTHSIEIESRRSSSSA